MKLILLFIIVLTICSCKKTYTCTCNITYVNHSPTETKYSTQIDMQKKQAKKPFLPIWKLILHFYPAQKAIVFSKV